MVGDGVVCASEKPVESGRVSGRFDSFRRFRSRGGPNGLSVRADPSLAAFPAVSHAKAQRRQVGKPVRMISAPSKELPSLKTSSSPLDGASAPKNAWREETPASRCRENWRRRKKAAGGPNSNGRTVSRCSSPVRPSYRHRLFRRTHVAQSLSVAGRRPVPVPLPGRAGR